jgi:hypothetical protein
MTWLAWLAVAVVVTAIAAITGIQPKGARPAHTSLMGVALRAPWDRHLRLHGAARTPAADTGLVYGAGAIRKSRRRRQGL